MKTFITWTFISVSLISFLHACFFLNNSQVNGIFLPSSEYLSISTNNSYDELIFEKALFRGCLKNSILYQERPSFPSSIRMIGGGANIHKRFANWNNAFLTDGIKRASVSIYNTTYMNDEFIKLGKFDYLNITPHSVGEFPARAHLIFCSSGTMECNDFSNLFIIESNNQHSLKKDLTSLTDFLNNAGYSVEVIKMDTISVLNHFDLVQLMNIFMIIACGVLLIITLLVIKHIVKLQLTTIKVFYLLGTRDTDIYKYSMFPFVRNSTIAILISSGIYAIITSLMMPEVILITLVYLLSVNLLLNVFYRINLSQIKHTGAE